MSSGSIRNLKCPCGSGKKYKKCCMGKTENRTCPRCQKELLIPSESRNYSCPFCKVILKKINEPSLIEMFNTEDKIDTLIAKKLLHNLGMQTNMLELVFPGDEKKRSKFLSCMMKIAQSLMKANSHKRRYCSLEEKGMKELELRNLNWENGHITSSNPIELNAEIDAFMVQIKAAIDLLAQSTQPIFGFNHTGWRRKKDRDGIEKSGLKILNSLKGTSRNPNFTLKNLIEFTEKNMEWLTYLANLRHEPVHWGNTRATNLTYNPESKKASPQMIIHSSQSREFVKDFLSRTLDQVLKFIHTFLLLSLNSILSESKGILIELDKEGGILYRIPDLKLKK